MTISSGSKRTSITPSFLRDVIKNRDEGRFLNNRGQKSVRLKRCRTGRSSDASRDYLQSSKRECRSAPRLP